MRIVAIRTSASSLIGIGHFMRCLTLACMLKELGIHIIFICNRDLPSELVQDIQQEHFDLKNTNELTTEKLNLVEDAMYTTDALKNFQVEWLIVDHYGINENWERQLRACVRNIIVIDDLANRHHDCDVLLDQNLYPNPELRYHGLVPEKTILFLGPAYFLIRPNFYEHYDSKHKQKDYFHVFVNFGGSDPTKETNKILSLIYKNEQVLPRLHFHIVAGPANPQKKIMYQNSQYLNQVTYYEQANIPQLLTIADFAIGAGGTMLWERCFMGVPSAVIIVADNQREGTREAERLGLIWNLGESKDVTEGKILHFLQSMLTFNEERDKLRERCLSFMEPLRKKGQHPVVTMIKEET
ncbi:UDP-2,4-diacetamido-2,4,6-trideoxy-beta-L-altropyranose hydrolase [Paenibacillus sp. ClWae2A]|uniref:UDP-2,4-diacetamido-2,4, 6-trideoxy-beta-L-altropyranose hydrolase n=1 Tax=Paenibacillus sp. ClWae2A TaxID=3057177 RepID=UPI0028F67A76|nr:UDP-2,4-diacetamido-2,4,6-trideoxy-beta-L-altropyranose hydrolase [Paenibacillus sp. ClWae2A]MDT9720517.1 UDP-2,4-diacetamido-2,4,6-trideoxy-beta-L-altropyranose hydrolase [Paenibacillus sp. ClWae2A]